MITGFPLRILGCEETPDHSPMLENKGVRFFMSMQSVILAVIALLSFPMGLIVGVFVGILVQDLREINKLLPGRQDVFYRSPCIPDHDDNNESQFFGDDR
jgi:hypothetical protein